MKHVAWFRLVLRVVGIVLVALSAPSIVSVIASLLYAAWSYLRADPMDVNTGAELTEAVLGVVWSLGTIGELALGLYLFLNPKWLMKVCIEDITYRCPACRFDLRGLTAPLACPECGVRLPGDIPPLPLPVTSEPGSTSAKAEKSYNSGEEPSGPVA
jgi:hypothetical protein